MDNREDAPRHDRGHIRAEESPVVRNYREPPSRPLEVRSEEVSRHMRAEEKSSDNDDNEDELILYPNFGFWITDIRSELILPKEADLVSIKIKGGLPFTASSSDLNALVFVGQNKYFGRIIDEADNSITLEGSFDEVREKNGELVQLKINKPEKIEYYPTEITVHLRNKYRDSVPISYKISPASGKISYILDLEERSLSQRLLASVPFSFKGPLKVMVGDIRIARSNQEGVRAQAMAKTRVLVESDDEFTSTETTSIEEYKTLKLGIKKLEQGPSIQTLQNFENLSISKFYQYNFGRNEVNVGYSFVTSSFLASGSCRIDRLIPLGDTHIPETQSGKEVKLYLGTTSRIVIRTTDISPQSGKMSSYGSSTNERDVSLESKIENMTNEVAQIRLEYTVFNAEISKLVSEVTPVREGSLLVFILQAKTGKTIFKTSFHLKY